jgi:serine phosphatase RsbU (regulator of sigma subunit)
VPAIIGGCRVTTLYRPGEERIELGGDFYDVIERRNGTLSAIIGDVSGHGPEAAGLAAMLRAAWQSLNHAEVDAETLVDAMAEILDREKGAPDSFATVCMARIDPHGRSVSLLDLGHPPPLLIGDDVRPLTVKPLPPLGVAAGAGIRITTTALPEHWSIFFYTDGLIEGRATPGSAERYGDERLAERLRSDCGGGAMFEAAACLGKLVSDIETAHGGQLPDDVAVVVISS